MTIQEYNASSFSWMQSPDLFPTAPEGRGQLMAIYLLLHLLHLTENQWGGGLVSAPLLILLSNKHKGNIWNTAVGLSAERKFNFYI